MQPFADVQTVPTPTVALGALSRRVMHCSRVQRGRIDRP